MEILKKSKNFMIPNMPKTTINLDHLPDHKCRVCKCIRFKTEIIIKYDPLRWQDKFIIPVYSCVSCGEVLDLKVQPKKMSEQ